MPVEFLPDFGMVTEIVSGIVSDPISAVLLAIGAVLVGASSAVFGGLSVGGLVSAIGRYAASSGPQD